MSGTADALGACGLLADMYFQFRYGARGGADTDPGMPAPGPETVHGLTPSYR
jgi:hypothetical protein